MQIRTVVLDDSPLQLIANCKVVARNPYLKLVASFTDARLAVRYLNEDPVDLLLTDVEMPVMDGFRVIETVPSHIHVFINSTDAGFAPQAVRSGASAFLHKPVTGMDLEDAISAILKKGIGDDGKAREPSLSRKRYPVKAVR
ncbi:two-component system, chemotaxis family, response regulator CheY/two-component system, response regulator YesN [Maribacter dokdonensis]|uniref:Two-component system, chemotaxis family, response regulator CheY/two-component system, response regulator YesN n=1 Tax=Maribacter dokdonensis TaxID=320912 RepID=A0A1H4V0Q1_9FLAO|nr:response regulator [Maribacter dokdonensis]SEC74659.1 two-component system, chemotaxis family, response regulator CheY/two-component system, response regulator YesN [Maribacter dokdonensis]